MSGLTALFVLAPVAFAVSAVLVAAVRRWSLRRGVIDRPNARSSHTVPTPTSGGIGIVVAVVCGLAALLARNPGGREAMVVATLAAVAIAAVSLVDDLRGLSAVQRLAVQVGAAATFVGVLGVEHRVDLPWLDLRALGMPGTAAAVVWIVGLTNAFNFMDGIDGIAGTQAVVAGVTLAITGSMAADALTAGAGAIVAGASAGFLTHNRPPARIFMGDVGSAFLGFILGALILAGAGRPWIAVAGVLALWPFLFDATFTFLRRLRLRENVFEAHRSHLYQRLTTAGYSHGHVSLLYGALASLGGAAGIALGAGLGGAARALLAAVLVAAPMLWAAVIRAERRCQ